jgi:hypothetical protein
MRATVRLPTFDGPRGWADRPFSPQSARLFIVVWNGRFVAEGRDNRAGFGLENIEQSTEKHLRVQRPHGRLISPGFPATTGC